MLDNGVLIIGLCLLVVAIAYAAYPWRKSRWILVSGSMLLVIYVVLAYLTWGAFFKLQTYKRHQETVARARAILHKPHGLEALIDQIQQNLQKNPQDAQGWFLLGRLYANQQKWILAQQAFRRSYHLTPHAEKVVLNYAQSILLATGKPLQREIRWRLMAISQQQPAHVDAWMLLAEDAYKRHAYQQAIVFWNNVLGLLPANSKEANALRQTIVKTMHLLEKK